MRAQYVIVNILRQTMSDADDEKLLCITALKCSKVKTTKISDTIINYIKMLLRLELEGLIQAYCRYLLLSHCVVYFHG